MQNNLFKKSSVERISSPEQLDGYIKVTNPSVWLILAAALILLAAALVWGIFGSMQTTVTMRGMAGEGTLTCYIDPSAGVTYGAGMDAAVIASDGSTLTGEVSEVGATPLSYAEAAEGIESDYAVYALSLTDWNLPVTVSVGGGSLIPGEIYTVTVTTQSVRPISLIFG